MPLQRLSSELPRQNQSGNERLLELIQALGWIRTNDTGIAVIAPAGDRILNIGSEKHKLRRALLDYVEVARPPWLMFALDGRMKTLKFAPIEFSQSMSEAYLGEGYDDEVVEFWDTLAALARGQQNIRLSSIGRQGERLTLAYEKQRTGRDPIWRSIESNADGYDVLSVLSSDDHAQRPIEVKTSTMGMAGTLHLTRNEWESTDTMAHHAFHLWDLKNSASPKLAIVPRALMAQHVPTDNGGGSWREVEISFQQFADIFSLQTVS